MRTTAFEYRGCLVPALFYGFQALTRRDKRVRFWGSLAPGISGVFSFLDTIVARSPFTGGFPCPISPRGWIGSPI